MFFMTYARSRPNEIIPYAEANQVPIMTNAAHRWSERTDRFLELRDYNTPRIVDSGGYNVQAQHGAFPWTVEEYHEWLSEHQERFTWAACMDFACEERFDELHSVETRMEKTTDNAIEHFDLDPDYQLLPVLQGRSIEQYVESYEMLEAHGIPTEYVGLGTVCRLSSSDEIVATERAIRARCKNIEKIHGFGVKIQAFKLGATFDTADSQAWVYGPSNGWYYKQTEDGLERVEETEDAKKRTIQAFVNYYNHAKDLMNTTPDHYQSTIV